VRLPESGLCQAVPFQPFAISESFSFVIPGTARDLQFLEFQGNTDSSSLSLLGMTAEWVRPGLEAGARTRALTSPENDIIDEHV
jgi:hypothetical protein